MKRTHLIAIIMTIVMSISICLDAKGKGGKGGGNHSGQGHGHVHQGISNKENPNRRPGVASNKPIQSNDAPAKTDKPSKEVKSNKASKSSQGRDAKITEKPEKASKSEKRANQGINKGSGQGHTQQRKALQQQFRHEKTKHLRRQARLARIRELAVAKGDTKIIARVDQLIKKEGQRFEYKWQRMEKHQAEINGVLKAETSIVTDVSSVPDLTKDKNKIKKPNLPKPVLD